MKTKNVNGKPIEHGAKQSSGRIFKKVIAGLILFLCIAGKSDAQVSIAPLLIGQNAWYIDVSSSFDVNVLDWAAIQASGVKSMRVGGNGITWTSLSEANLKIIVKKIRQNGIEPLVQVGFDPRGNLITQATSAATLVHDLNSDSDPDYHVTYWIITNEPDLNFGFNNTAGADTIENYTREYSTRMKAQDSNIKIIGPELASYYVGYAVYDALTNGSSVYPTANATCILPYIDIFSYHIYPFGNENTLASGYSMSATRDNVTKYLSGVPAAATFANSVATNPFRSALSQIRTKLDANGGSAIGIAITEANICFYNDVSATNGNDDNITGTGANSFIAGQFWAEIIVECERADVKFLNFWSVKEGQSGDSYLTNVGYMNNDPSKFGGVGGLKPTYFHTEMLAENFSAGTFYSTTAESGNADSKVKAYVTTDGGIVKVLVFNENVNSTQSSASSKSIAIRFNNAAPTGSGNYKFRTDATVSGLSFTELTISNIDNESSWVFEYNSSGTLVKQCYYKLYGTNALTYDCDTFNTCNPPTAGSNSPVCSGSSITLTASLISGASYSWTGPNSFTSSSQNPVITSATTAATGTYSVTATVGTCTSTAATVSVTVGTSSAPTAGSNSPVCQSATISLTCSLVSGATYSWTGPNSFTSVSQNPTITGAGVNMAGTYSVTTTISGCTSAAGTTVVDVPNFASIGTGGSTTFCSGGSVALYASTGSGYSWQWRRNGSDITTGGTANNYTALLAGNYDVRIYNGTCYAWSSPTTVTVNSTSAPTAGGNTPVCAGSTINLTATTVSGATYSWTGPNSFTSNSQNPNITNATTAMAGTYSVTATANSCTSTAGTKAITVNAIPATPTAASNSPVCQSASINLTSNTISGATYSWTGPNSFTSGSEDPIITGASVAMSGTYYVTRTVSGCTSAQTSTTVTVPNFAFIGVGGSTTFCSGGTVALYASTGSGYSWQWSKNGVDISGATANNYTTLSSTTVTSTYQVRVYNGTCYAWSAPTTVTINSGLVATITPAGATAVCSPSTVLLYGNTCSGYTYIWQKKDGSGVYQVISGATSANYTATVTGWYQIEVSSGGSHSWSSGIEVTIAACRLADPSNTVNVFQSNVQLSVFPNPTKGEFTVMINAIDETVQFINIEISNSLGQAVYKSEEIAVTGSSYEARMSIPENYDNGLYIVTVTIGEQVIRTKIFILK